MSSWLRTPRQAQAPSMAEQQQQQQKEESPFVVFRRFAEEQINALMQGFHALPGMHSDSPRAKEQLRTWEQEMREVRQKMDEQFPELWKALVTSPERRPGEGSHAVNEDARMATRALLLQSRNANVGTDPNRILKLFQDHSDTMLPVSGPLPIRTGTHSSWLGVDWFRRSPYSPIQLEQHEHAHQHGSMWRAAFEDLMDASLGKEMIGREAWDGTVDNQKLYASWAQPGLDWMLDLQCRGVLPPQLPNLYSIAPTEKRKLDRVFGKIIAGTRFWTPYGRLAEQDFEQLARVIASPDMEDLAPKPSAEWASSELDMYERFLGRQEATQPESSEQPGQDAMPEPENISIIATLTTTETTTMPDGTRHTKRVLKQRFADGREESREEVSTILTGESSIDDKRENEVGDKTGKTGWFWQ